jgi:hypothetical protein
MKVKLSTLWITASLSYLYCDVISLMDPELLGQYLEGNVNGLAFTPGFLLGAAILISIPISMVLLSRVLNYRANRWTNITAGTVMTAVQLSTLFIGCQHPTTSSSAFLKLRVRQSLSGMPGSGVSLPFSRESRRLPQPRRPPGSYGRSQPT